jgi:lipid-A-disaccharide synthase-like uncharacterized protein
MQQLLELLMVVMLARYTLKSLGLSKENAKFPMCLPVLVWYIAVMGSFLLLLRTSGSSSNK